MDLNENDDDSGLEIELEALKSTYDRELEIREENGKVSAVSVNLEPATGDDQNSKFVYLSLTIAIPPNYPHILPAISIRKTRGLSDEAINRISEAMRNKAIESKGEPMLFSLIDIAKELLTVSNLPFCHCTICLYGFSDTDVFTKTDCYHYFHSYCLSKFISHSQDIWEQNQKDVTPQSNSKQFQAECPMCRFVINFSHKQSYPLPKELATEDAPFHLTDEMKASQQEFKELFEKQKANGGIIDIETEKKKFEIEISSIPTICASAFVSSTAKPNESSTKLGARSNYNQSRHQSTRKSAFSRDQERRRDDSHQNKQRLDSFRAGGASAKVLNYRERNKRVPGDQKTAITTAKTNSSIAIVPPTVIEKETEDSNQMTIVSCSEISTTVDDQSINETDHSVRNQVILKSPTPANEILTSNNKEPKTSGKYPNRNMGPRYPRNRNNFQQDRNGASDSPGSLKDSICVCEETASVGWKGRPKPRNYKVNQNTELTDHTADNGEPKNAKVTVKDFENQKLGLDVYASTYDDDENSAPTVRNYRRQRKKWREHGTEHRKSEDSNVNPAEASRMAEHKVKKPDESCSVPVKTDGLKQSGSEQFRKKRNYKKNFPENPHNKGETRSNQHLPNREPPKKEEHLVANSPDQDGPKDLLSEKHSTEKGATYQGRQRNYPYKNNHRRYRNDSFTARRNSYQEDKVPSDRTKVDNIPSSEEHKKKSSNRTQSEQDRVHNDPKLSETNSHRNNRQYCSQKDSTLPKKSQLQKNTGKFVDDEQNSLTTNTPESPIKSSKQLSTTETPQLRLVQPKFHPPGFPTAKPVFNIPS